MNSEKINEKAGVPGREHDGECLKKGAAIEQSEHPWASPATARRIAQDHLSSDPEYYEGEEDEDDEGEEAESSTEGVPPPKGRKSLADLVDEDGEGY